MLESIGFTNVSMISGGSIMKNLGFINVFLNHFSTRTAHTYHGIRVFELWACSPEIFPKPWCFWKALAKELFSPMLSEISTVSERAPGLRLIVPEPRFQRDLRASGS